MESGGASSSVVWGRSGVSRPAGVGMDDCGGSTRQDSASSKLTRDDDACISRMAGKSISQVEIGAVSNSSGRRGGCGGNVELTDDPRGTTASGSSRSGSSPSSSLIESSMKPAATFAGTPIAEHIASVFANIVPQSQKAWRYSLAWYLQALRHVTSVKTMVAGAAATPGSPPAALATARR